MTGRGVALVTGAAGGIGRAIAMELAAQRHHVVLGDLDLEAVSVIEQAIRTAGGSATAVQLDITSQESRAKVIRLCAEDLGGLNTLVNCAGVLQDSLIERMPLAMFSRVLEINLVSPLALIAETVDLMRRSGGGAMINIASRAWLGIFGSTAYGTSKGGLVGASRALALELGRDGITVNCIAPGFIETDMSASLPPKVREATLASLAVRRAGQPSDVATAVAFLAQAPYCTGQVLPLCGGRSIGTPTISLPTATK